MFVDTRFASRIERAEALLLRSVVEPNLASARAPRALFRDLGSSFVGYLRRGSPLNKVIGIGLDAPFDETALAGIEAAMQAREEPTRVELSTLAGAEVSMRLLSRGYRLLGFEHVLVRALTSASTPATANVRVERVRDATTHTWRRVSLEAVSASDATGTPVETHSNDVMVAAVDDFLAARGLERYLAYVGDAVAGAASLWLHEDIAVLTGCATLSAWRRRGAHGALIAARLSAARARGAEFAIVTTAPGSQSQANAMRHGFSLAYARAILVAGAPSEHRT